MTEKDVVMRERAAFERGFLAGLTRGSRTSDPSTLDLYPFPKITRPRVVKIGDWTYRIYEGALQTQRFGDWMGNAGVTPIKCAEDAYAFADLFANPTETVEDDS